MNKIEIKFNIWDKVYFRYLWTLSYSEIQKYQIEKDWGQDIDIRYVMWEPKNISIWEEKEMIICQDDVFLTKEDYKKACEEEIEKIDYLVNKDYE